MKRILYLGIVALMVSCSSSKYAANFQRSGSDFGYGELVHAEPKTKAIPPEQLVASTSIEVPVLTPQVVTVDAAKIRESISRMDKSKRQEFKKALKEEIRYMKAKVKKSNSDNAVVTPERGTMDHDLRLAIIFGAIGITGLLIGTQAFYIVGAIALIIGVVFLIMWVTRQ